MKKFYFICLIFILCLTITVKSNAQANIGDSLAMVDLYKSTHGKQWFSDKNWLTANPLDTWFGLTVMNGRVVAVTLNFNNLTGSLPSSTGNCTQLRNLALRTNHLKDTIPASIGNCRQLTELDLQYNYLSGKIPSSVGECTKLKHVELGDNLLTGSIPASIGNCTGLKFIDLSGNRLTGNIPSEIGNCKKLKSLDFGANKLSGTIPASIGNCTELRLINFQHNSLEGSIPSTFGNCINLEFLALFENQLTGNIPNTLGRCSNLAKLFLDNNKLSGAIPKELGNCVKLVYLFLNNNQLTGALPEELGNCADLYWLSVGYNQLSGPLPVSIGNCKRLFIMSAYYNSFSGSIPDSYATLNDCNFYFSQNELNGLPSTSMLATFQGSFKIDMNHYTFTPLEPVAGLSTAIYYSPQKNIAVKQTGNILSVSAGGALSNNTYQWYKNGRLIKTVTGDSTVNATWPGSYYATVSNAVVTNLVLQSDTLSVNADASGLSAVNTKKSISVFPNPAKDHINILLPGNEYYSGELKAANIYDESGRLVKSETVSNRANQITINIASLSNGIYYAEVNMNGVISRQKFVKQ